MPGFLGLHRCSAVLSFALFPGPRLADYLTASCAWLRFWAAQPGVAGFRCYLSGFAEADGRAVAGRLRAAAGNRAPVAVVACRFEGPAFAGRRWLGAALRFAGLWDTDDRHLALVLDVHDHLPTQRREAGRLVTALGGATTLGVTFWAGEGPRGDCPMPAGVVLPRGHVHLDGGLLALAPGPSRDRLRRADPPFLDAVRQALERFAADGGCARGADEALLEEWLRATGLAPAVLGAANPHRSFLAAPPAAPCPPAGPDLGPDAAVTLRYHRPPPSGAALGLCRERRPKRPRTAQTRTQSDRSGSAAGAASAGTTHRTDRPVHRRSRSGAAA